MTGAKEMAMDLRQQEIDEKQFGVNTPSIVQSGLITSQTDFVDLTKDEIRARAMQVVDSIMDGNEDPLEVLIAVKKGLQYFETLEENVKTIVYGKQYTSKGEVLKMHNVEVEAADFSKWDYKNCEDKQLEYYTAKVKEQQIFLQTIKKPVERVDVETGEVYIAKPAVKMTTSGYKISVK